MGIQDSLWAQDGTPASDEKIRTMLKVSKADRMLDQMLDGLSLQMKQSFDPIIATLPEKDRPVAQKVMDEFWIRFIESARANGETLISDIGKIYKKHLTEEEVQASIEFYQTPSGQSLLDKMPTVMMESFAVGRSWGEKMGATVMKGLVDELKKEIPEFGKAPNQAN